MNPFFQENINYSLQLRHNLLLAFGSHLSK